MQPVCREGLAAGHPPPQRSGGRSGDAESPRLWRGVEGGGGGGPGKGIPASFPGPRTARPGPARPLWSPTGLRLCPRTAPGEGVTLPLRGRGSGLGDTLLVPPPSRAL